jgi:apolipoprotein N-acyltransferase
MVSKDNLKYAIFCIVTGLLSVCSFPKINLFFLIWIAFIPLIFAIRRVTATPSFVLGFLSGFVFNACGLYWLIPMVQFNSGSYAQAFIDASLLWVYLALYWGVWSLGLQRYISFQKDKSSNWLIIVFGSCFWVLLEYVKAYFLTGFPWMLIGYSQFEFTEIIQVAEFTGVYGVSFLILFCNLCFYFWLESKNKKKYLYTSLILIVLFTFFGSIRTYRFRLPGEEKYNVSILQPNIDQYKKWDKDYLEEILSNLQKQAVEVGKSKTDLVLWPETVLPGVIPEDVVLVNFAKRVSSYTRSFNIFGTLYNEDDKLFNAVVGFDANDGLIDVHRKNHLVPFGEFVPFRKLLTRFSDILNRMGDIDRGKDANVSNRGDFFIGRIICSENFFPDMARRFVLSGAKVLTSHTNDAWFFDTAAPHQHFVMNVFRAVENRRFVLVSANTGVSGIIEASGIVLSRTNVLKKDILNGTFSQNDFKTFYTKFGDVFAKACIIAVMILILFSCYKNSCYKKRRDNK